MSGWNPPTNFAPYPWQDSPSERTPMDSDHLQAAEQALAAWVQTLANLLGVAPTPIKTGAYTALAGEFVPVNATGSSVAVTLPNTPADETRVGVKMLATSGTNTVTINTSGGDVFNPVTGSTSMTLTLAGQAAILQYAASPGAWYTQANNLPLSGLDGRYATSASSVSSVFSRSGAVTAVDGDYVGVIAAPHTGATAGVQFVGGTASGAPTTGTFSVGDYVVARDGQIWICTVAGTPGTWGNAGASAGVGSFNTRSGAVVPATGDYTAAQVTNAADRSSSSTQAFTGKLSTTAVIATGLTGATAASRYVGATASGPPVSGTFVGGDWVIDQGKGTIWVCSSSGSPGTWIASLVSPSTNYRPPGVSETGSLQTIAPTLYASQITIPAPVTLTGISYYAPSSHGGSLLVSLFNSTGTKVAASNSTTAATSLQRVPFTSPYAATGGVYYLGIQSSNVATIQMHWCFAAANAISQGSFAVPASITAPTGPYTTAPIPILCSY